MKKETTVYYVRWVETHETEVMASSEEEAIAIALKNAGCTQAGKLSGQPIAIAA